MERKIIVTEDKSKTLLIPALNETYHSKNGALSESLHIFIHAGFNFVVPKTEIRIFEMGFGTGLNALTTLHSAIKSNTVVDYYGIEKYPLSLDEALSLSFSDLKELEVDDKQHDIHACAWNEKIAIHPLFNLTKLTGDLHERHDLPQQIDLIYYDAFGPPTQPDLWTEAVMKRMFDLLNPNGVLVTYCAQGQFKRNLKAAGFIVENLPGPAGKREITRAIKQDT